PDADRPTLHDVNLHIEEGELCLVVGRTGVGKSTLLGCINGLVPHFTGGHLRGSVTVDGRDTSTHPPRELADVVGVVGQDPLAGFVTDIVEEELAYGMEQLAIPPDVMRKRVEETLDLLGIAELRARALRTLSGGQQQRVAIGSVLTAHPRVLILDEPTSALDPTAAEEVLAAVTRLVHDLGVTVVIAEHRLERVVQYADRIVHLRGDGTVESGPPGLVLENSSVAPPVVELGRLAGWSPLPLSVRDARRLVSPLREQLSGLTSGSASVSEAKRFSPTRGQPTPVDPTRGQPTPVDPTRVDPTRVDPGETPTVSARQLVVKYGNSVAVREVDLDLQPGEIVGLMGRNGSGKSSLLWALQGSLKHDGGSVAAHTEDGQSVDPATVSPGEARRLTGLVPQTPSDLLYLTTVAQECEQADRDAGAAQGSCSALLDRLVPGIDREAHPRDLSEGQRLALVLAIQMTATPQTLLLDEPTRGLDYGAKASLSATLRKMADDGRSVMIATHDVEFVASACDRVVVLAQGEVVAEGSTMSVVVASPAFAPQVAKILAPEPWLTVDQVRVALSAEAPSADGAASAAGTGPTSNILGLGTLAPGTPPSGQSAGGSA
ncbi:MAG TPA: ATP-binding cassette domain-containing protein, partial [Microthrixaceae bacterium]|nr:ATP-binding cassette domain-containing protein [Microthrixaceae bacterium]